MCAVVCVTFACRHGWGGGQGLTNDIYLAQPRGALVCVTLTGPDDPSRAVSLCSSVEVLGTWEERVLFGEKKKYKTLVMTGNNLSICVYRMSEMEQKIYSLILHREHGGTEGRHGLHSPTVRRHPAKSIWISYRNKKYSSGYGNNVP